VTWWRALTYVGIWAALTLYYLGSNRSSHPVAEAPASAKPNELRLLPKGASAVGAFELEAGGRILRCRRVEDQWEVLYPQHARVPSDLIAATVGALADLEAIKVVGSELTPQAEAEFGLSHPLVRLSVGDATSHVTVLLGLRNPAQTAVYARREGEREVLLVGLNVQYYVDLLLETLRRQTG